MRLKKLEGATIKVNRDCFLQTAEKRMHGNTPVHGSWYDAGSVVEGYTGKFNPDWMELIADPVGDAKRAEAEEKKAALEAQKQAEKEAAEKKETEQMAQEAAAKAKAEKAEKEAAEEPPVPPEPEDFEDETPDEEVPATDPTPAVVETTATRRRSRAR